MTNLNTIAQLNKFIVLDKYTKLEQATYYQSEADLERELLMDLVNQGYERRNDLTSRELLLNNVRTQLQNLNKVSFSDAEWQRFVENYLDNPSDNIVDKTRKLHDNYIHDFVFDDGHIKNIHLIDKQHLANNKVQVINQFEQSGTHANRYDVTILINGLPLVHIELKKRGVSIREAFNQIHRYSKESFNSDNSLFKYLQIFVISNGTDTKYFANTTKRDKNSYDFTMNWAKSDNSLINDLKDFTATFFQKNTLLKILFNYSVFDVENTLLIMRPYQIAATERILWKINSSYENKNWSKVESGGYIWHTTGSGKTLTSFKVAQLATSLPFIDKVLFVVDRKDLDMQTMKEYRKFSPDSVNGSINTNGLLHNLESSNDKKIVVTTIQKLNRLVARENSLSIYDKQVVLIFDEAHRSQFNEAQKNITRRFKKYYQFGFTGTPIFSDNALDDKTTESVFGKELHSYVITDAIRDEKVLKFKVDYHDVRPKFKSFEIEQDEKKLSSAETKQALLNPERIKEIAQYILANFKQKTHRLHGNNKGFNAMFAVSSVDAAKLYYEAFKKLQTGVANPLKIATIFSYASNEEQASICDIADESLDLDVAAIDMSAKEFLDVAISDYNNMFKTNYSTDAEKFQNYYSNVSERVKKREIDLIIVVGMFLTGFDAKTLNTLFVDKNLRYHGLIQAYSRTNRIYDATKSFGNIVTFRNLESATIDAIRLFGESNTRNIILEKSYQEHMEGFTNILTNEVRRGYLNIVAELQEKFPNHDEIITEKDKKEFTKLFGEYLRAENILQNYDEFVALKALQHIDRTNNNAVEKFKNQYYVSDEDFNTMSKICLPNDRCIQNYRSTYNDIREWLQREKAAQNESKSTLDWDDVTFEVELLKSQKINLDYILELLFEKNKDIKDKALLIEDIRLIIRSSLDNPHQEDLIVKFINQTNLDDIISQENILEAFYTFAQQEQQDEFEHLISVEDLNRDETKRYIEISLKRQYASEHGTELSKILPKMSKVDPQYKTKKQKVFQKVSVHIEKYKNIGRSINY